MRHLVTMTLSEKEEEQNVTSVYHLVTSDWFLSAIEDNNSHDSSQLKNII